MTIESFGQILVDISEKGLSKQQKDGSMPSGHNGPWKDNETPVRNTSHWTILFLHTYDRTGDERFREAANCCIKYLLSDEARPNGETFHHRNSAERDSCNGVIGQAWSIEALAIAANYFDNSNILTTAEEVFLKHPFNETLALWHPVEIDGEKQGIDLTFNHQLWFAAAGAVLSEHHNVSKTVRQRVVKFLDELEMNLSLHSNGLIKHIYKPKFNFKKYATVFLDGIRSGIAHKMITSQVKTIFSCSSSDNPSLSDEKTVREIGYHSFNLYALAIIYNIFPDHTAWETNSVLQGIEYACSEEYYTSVQNNGYAFGFNPTGVELAYIYTTFECHPEISVSSLLSEQLDRTYHPEKGIFNKNTNDPETLTARMYEATRIIDI